MLKLDAQREEREIREGEQGLSGCTTKKEVTMQCAVGIVKRKRDQPINQPTNQPTFGHVLPCKQRVRERLGAWNMKKTKIKKKKIKKMMMMMIMMMM